MIRSNNEAYSLADGLNDLLNANVFNNQSTSVREMTLMEVKYALLYLRTVKTHIDAIELLLNDRLKDVITTQII